MTKRMSAVRVFHVLVVLALGSIGSGCSHNMRITNLDDNFTTPSAVPKQTVRVGVTSSSMSHPQTSKYVNAIVEALQRNSGVERVIYPYSHSNNKGQADAVVDISVNTRYDGKGSNFFVNWPGFLIFAPAIWGYGYTADIETQAFIDNLKTGSSQQLSMPLRYEFRQAEFDRTWTGIGWFEVGIIPLIGGLAFTGYDDDVTPEFIRTVTPSYGSFVAQKTANAIYDSMGY